MRIQIWQKHSPSAKERYHSQRKKEGGDSVHVKQKVVNCRFAKGQKSGGCEKESSATWGGKKAQVLETPKPIETTEAGDKAEYPLFAEHTEHARASYTCNKSLTLGRWFEEERNSMVG